MIKRNIFSFVVAAATAVACLHVQADDGILQFKPGAQGVDYDSKRGLADHEEFGASLGLEYMYGRWGT
ncbi:MAG: hypothetical protein KJO24_05050, partial [Gammaproteobacteria bacterium]|nr:hypothetical protein [Gammaproteobacteria bacterium]